MTCERMSCECEYASNVNLLCQPRHAVCDRGQERVPQTLTKDQAQPSSAAATDMTGEAVTHREVPYCELHNNRPIFY